MCTLVRKAIASKTAYFNFYKLIVQYSFYSLKSLVLLGRYAMWIGSYLLTFRNNLTVPSSRVNKGQSSWPLKIEPIYCPETLQTNYQSTLRNVPEQRNSHLRGGGSLKSLIGRSEQPDAMFPKPQINKYINYLSKFIITVYDWLRAGRSGDRIPVGVRFSAPVQTGPGAHPASCTMGTGSFPGGRKRPGRDTDHSPLLVPKSKNRVKLYLYSP
jgi:hypothetical protein